MRIPIALAACVAVAIAAMWWALGHPALVTPMLTPSGASATPPSGSAGKFYCVSYAPFRRGQSPLGTGAAITKDQIEQDIAHLSQLTDCVRTYSTDFGLEFVPEIARKHDMQVIQGIWLSPDAAKNKVQIETGVRLANDYPGTVRAVVVGNEVLLRGDMAAPALIKTIAEVKRQVKVPVTYADVWEYWLRNRDIASVTDFVTVHILPYWEDFPIPAADAAAHVDSIHARVVAAFPGKDILIGETGWPSAGRMREGALPSPSNQARVIEEATALARKGNYHANIIEAFDQPWKRNLEGTVGGHWGLFDADTRLPKFLPGAPVSDHPGWLWQAACGIVLALVVFAGAASEKRRRTPLATATWLRVTAIALAAGALIGWVMEKAMLESFGYAGTIRSALLVVIAATTPLLASMALGRGTPLPTLAQVLGSRAEWPESWLGRGLGMAFVLILGVALCEALGLVFNPRYHDFAFAAMTVATVALSALTIDRRGAGPRGMAEMVAAAVIALSVVYILFNEGFLNWQSLWLCAALAGFIVVLIRGPAAPDSGSKA
ncbi:MAG TPA: glycosyl hydrolase family 17 protein [Xanthobacteraceae bacterium]|jgi:exo-beta-1,3-glucanase (GH17 family)|nr:glycosyl hydrolase family 17 protein [Xanthobacteraceae bacterium]